MYFFFLIFQEKWLQVKFAFHFPQKKSKHWVCFLLFSLEMKSQIKWSAQFFTLAFSIISFHANVFIYTGTYAKPLDSLASNTVKIDLDKYH